MIALIGVILLIGIVKKNAIMMIDFALRRRARGGQRARRGDLPGVPAAIPADHDDDDGGAARRPAARPRHRRGLRAAPAARRLDRGRLDREPGAHALHDPGHLPGLRRPGAPLPAATGALRHSGRSPRELLGALHPAAGGHDAPDGRPVPGRRARLSAPAGVVAAAGRLPDDLGPGEPARRQPGDDGDVGRHAARAAVRPHRGRDRDDVHELPRRREHRAAVRSEPEHRRRRARRAGRHQRRAAAACPRRCRPTRAIAR